MPVLKNSIPTIWNRDNIHTISQYNVLNRSWQYHTACLEDEFGHLWNKFMLFLQLHFCAYLDFLWVWLLLSEDHPWATWQ